ncbi:hypothetical protein PG996_001916 [Apiospora saccharicola]|uniref:Uncharacterized protein n=1 Tax=Apiospora saccharicola TaxID=335842 RepID=A0ABR1WKW6_9PEZI
MVGCLKWCFGGRPEVEAEKGRDDFAANLEHEHQQISCGIAARLATADTAERIRIRDMFRDGDGRWFPSADEKGKGKGKGKGTMEWEEEEEEKKEQKTMMEGKERPEDEDESSSSSSATTESSRGSQLCGLSPMPMGVIFATAPGLEPSMTADLRPVLTDLPNAPKFTSSASGDGVATNGPSLFAVGSDDDE